MGLETRAMAPIDTPDQTVVNPATDEAFRRVEVSTVTPLAHLRSIVAALNTYEPYESVLHSSERLPDGTIRATVMEVGGGEEYMQWSNDYSRITVTPQNAMTVETLSVDAGVPLERESVYDARSVQFDPDSKEGIEEIGRFIYRLTPALVEAEGRLSDPSYREFGSHGEDKFRFAKKVDDKFPGILKEYPKMHLKSAYDAQRLVEMLSNNGINLTGIERLSLGFRDKVKVANKYVVYRDYGGFHIQII